jgi:chaperone modulatory protein CbpM
MMDTVIVYLRLDEICHTCDTSEDVLIQLVDHGIIEPRGDSPEEWRFDSRMVVVAKRAARLRRDLDLEWEGIALALTLLEEVEKLRSENSMLHQRLRRFLVE